MHELDWLLHIFRPPNRLWIASFDSHCKGIVQWGVGYWRTFTHLTHGVGHSDLKSLHMKFSTAPGRPGCNNKTDLLIARWHKITYLMVHPEDVRNGETFYKGKVLWTAATRRKSKSGTRLDSLSDFQDAIIWYHVNLTHVFFIMFIFSTLTYILFSTSNLCVRNSNGIVWT